MRYADDSRNVTPLSRLPDGCMWKELPQSATVLARRNKAVVFTLLGHCEAETALYIQLHQPLAKLVVEPLRVADACIAHELLASVRLPSADVHSIPAGQCNPAEHDGECFILCLRLLSSCHRLWWLYSMSPNMKIANPTSF